MAILLFAFPEIGKLAEGVGLMTRKYGMSVGPMQGEHQG